MYFHGCGIDDKIFSLEYVDSVPPLSKAARTGDLQKIKKLMSKGSLPQSADNRGWTAIHSCVAGNQIEALKLILKLKSKCKDHLVNLATWENVSPLLIALRAPRPSLEMVKVLLKAGADPKQHTFTKLSPLHLACLKKGNIDIVKLLVQFGADVNVQEDLSLCTPLHFAVCEGCDLEVIQFLINLSNLNLKNISDRTAFLEACNSNFFEAVEKFLEKDRNLTNFKSDIPAIVYACLAGNLKMVELLIDSGADVNCRCKAMLSCKSGDSDLILLDKENFLPIHSSLTNIDVFKLILKLTKPSNLLQLETNYYSFSLFVIIYADEIFLETLLQSDLPVELKTFNSQVLLKFILCYPDMEDIIVRKFPLIFKYNFALDPEEVFDNLFSKMSADALGRNFRLLNLLAQMGISSGRQFQNKNCVISFLESSMIDCKDSERLGVIRSSCDLLSQSVLTLKQYCRIVLRREIRSHFESDWQAVKVIRELDLPDSLKKFVFFESLK